MINRLNIKKILKDPLMRRKLFVRVIIATQAREGVITTEQQAEAAYDYIFKLKCGKF